MHNPTEPEPEPVLKVSEVARHLYCDPTTVYRLIHKGELKAVKVGRLYRVPKSALVEFLAAA